MFHPLSRAQIGQIVGLLVAQVQERLAERNITCELTEAGCDWLVKEGFDVSYGARPLRRAIQRHLENQLSRGVLAGEFAEGDHVIADVNEAGDGLTLSVSVPAPEQEKELVGVA